MVKENILRWINFRAVLVLFLSVVIAVLFLKVFLHGQPVFSACREILFSCTADVHGTGQTEIPLATTNFPLEQPASSSPVITWSRVDGAVAYEVELLTPDQVEGQPASADPTPFFSTRQVYSLGYSVVLPDDFKQDHFFWRVRGIGLDLQPVGGFSQPEAVYIDRQKNTLLKPTPTSIFNEGNGTMLLYPVYAWIPLPAAVQYEVELLDAPPENPNGIMPSVHRIDTMLTSVADLYDKKPRFSQGPLYWRVRGLGAAGEPVGVYSDAGAFSVIPQNVATYGDSITHGGGSISYSPADWEFSYQHYLDFQTLNLGRSGDTSEDSVDRFEQDVLPFHPQYLLILTGSNSLRSGVSAESVIDDLQSLQQKCERAGIRPVLLTLPPINPDNIERAFHEETVADWRSSFQEVNAYIRSQTHIDIAAPLERYDSILPTSLALDGIHLDASGKKIMAEVINESWPQLMTTINPPKIT